MYVFISRYLEMLIMIRNNILLFQHNYGSTTHVQVGNFCLRKKTTDTRIINGAALFITTLIICLNGVHEIIIDINKRNLLQLFDGKGCRHRDIGRSLW